MAQDFLISGCGRSGTKYISHLLCDLGVPCGHEHIFNPGAIASGNISWPPQIAGESSWLAAPFVGKLPPTVALYHQVRNPLAVVRSFLRMRFFSKEEPYKAYSDFAAQQEPRLLIGNEIEKCFRYWLHWNELVEKSAQDAERELIRFQLEELDAELVALIGRRTLPDLTVETVQAAIDKSDKSTNTTGDKLRDAAVGWADLTDESLKAAVLAQAERYGYSNVLAQAS